MLGASVGGGKTSLNRCDVVEEKGRRGEPWAGRIKSETVEAFRQAAWEPFSWG